MPQRSAADAAALWENETFRYAAPVRIGRGVVSRMRPRFPDWQVVSEWELMTDILNLRDFSSIIEVAGIVEGMGDNRRNGYGRFTSEITELKTGTSRAHAVPDNGKRGRTAMTTTFVPKREDGRALWRVVFDVVHADPPDTIYRYDEIARLLDTDHQATTSIRRSVVATANCGGGRSVRCRKCVVSAIACPCRRSMRCRRSTIRIAAGAR